MFVPWCNGSTPDFGSVSLGSNPGGTTDLKTNPLIIILIVGGLFFVIKASNPPNPTMVQTFQFQM